jgi:hypothetical protein
MFVLGVHKLLLLSIICFGILCYDSSFPKSDHLLRQNIVNIKAIVVTGRESL